jgi:hypothetical protein
MSHPLPGELPLHLVLLLYIINVLEVEVAGVSPSEHPAYLTQLYACLVFCLFSFSASPIALRFLGQASEGHEM